jgi:hypothetical protein
MAGAAADIVAWTVGAGLDGLTRLRWWPATAIVWFWPAYRSGAPRSAPTRCTLIVAQGHRWLAAEGVEEDSMRQRAIRSGNSARGVEADYERESWMRQSPAHQPKHYPAGYGHHGH